MRTCTGAPEPFFGPGVVVGAADEDDVVFPPAEAGPPDVPEVQPASTSASSAASTGSARIPLAPVRGSGRTWGTSAVRSSSSFVRLQGNGTAPAFRSPAGRVSAPHPARAVLTLSRN